ncbi:MAG: TonB family protein [Caulobacterales bacterium]
MTDVLIVCVRDDEVQAKALADLFEREGMSVGGAPADDAALKNCGATVVIWSQASIRSRPFLDAAQRVVNAGKGVVACLIDAPPASSLNQSPCFDLRAWNGSPDDPLVDPLYFAVDRMVNASQGARPAAAETSYAAPQPAFQQSAPPPYGRSPARQDTRPQEPPRYEAPRYEAPRAFEPAPEPRRRAPSPPAPDHAHDPISAEAMRWRAIRHSRDPAAFLHYLSEYGPEGAFAELAEMRLKQLQDSNTTPLKAAARSVTRAAPVARAEPRPEPRPAPRRPEPRDSWPEEQYAERPARMEAPRERAAARIDLSPPQEYYSERSAPPEKRGGGGAIRFVILFLILGGGALAAGMYFGNGQRFLPGQAVVAQQQEQAPTAVEEPMAGVQQEAATPPVADSNAVGGPTELEEANFNQPPARAEAPRPAQQREERFEASSANGTPASLMPGTPRTAPVQMASAAETARPTIAQGGVSWRTRATADDLSAAYPAAARRAGIEGRVRLGCTIRNDLGPDCVVVSETPMGQGFGDAALRIARNYRANPQLSDGANAEGARAELNMSFRPN